MKKKILIVYQHLPHYRYGVFDKLSRSEIYEYHFVADYVSKDGSIPTIPFECLPNSHHVTNLWIGPFLWQKGLLSLILREKYAAVIMLGDYAFISNWLISFLKKFLRLPVVYWTIGWHKLDKFPKNIVRRIFYKQATGMMIYGNCGVEMGWRNGYRFQRYAVIGNSNDKPLNGQLVGIKMSKEEFIGRFNKIKCSTLVGAAIRLNNGKRLDWAIQAVSLLRERGCDIGIVFIGDGPEKSNLRKLAESLNVPSIFFGALYQSDLLELFYAKLSATVIPVWAGLTAIQSLSNNTPVVTTSDISHQMPEYECVIEGVTGALYDYGDINELAAAISRAIKLKELAPEKFKKNAEREINSRWNSRAQAQLIENFMSTLL